MPITSMFYAQAYGGDRDVHLVRPQASRALNAPGSLEVVDGGTVDWASSYTAAHPGTRIEFRPTFASTANGTHHVGFGIRVEKATGQVSFEAGAPHPDAPPNFIVEAICTQNDGGTAPAQILPVPIRVHVHAGVRRIWITPGTIGIRRTNAAGPEPTHYRPTIRAEFTDDTLGDVSLLQGFTLTPADRIDTDPGRPGFIRLTAADTPGNSFTLTATAPATWAVTPATAQIQIQRRWADEPTPPRAHLKDGAIDGSTPPNILATRVPNILLLGQGFTQPDLDAHYFDSNANSLAFFLRTSAVTRPFDRLSFSMNYWSAAVPSGGRGVPVRCEVHTFQAEDPDSGTVSEVAYPVPVPAVPFDLSNWTLANLVYMAGLPLPTDAAPGRTPSQLRIRWMNTLRTPPPPSLGDDVIGLWQDLATRTFIEEFETFPGMTMGTPPSASGTRAPNFVDVDEERGGQAGLDAFLSALQAANGTTLPGGTALGDLWVTAQPDVRFDNRRYVVIVSNSQMGRAHAPDRYLSLPMRRGIPALKFLRVPGQREIRLDPAALAPPTFALEAQGLYRTLAHELGHELGLGDEYSEKTRVFGGTEADLAFWPNLTSEAELNAAGQTPAGGFKPEAIKWNWERARKAAVLSAPPDGLGGGELDVHVDPPGGVLFAVDDVVRLRPRQWRVPLAQVRVIGEYKVISVSAAGDLIRIREMAPVTTAPAYGPGSLIYCTVPAPDSVRNVNYPYARMMTRAAEKYIEDNGPMTGKTCNPDVELPRGSQIQVPLDLSFSDWALSWSRRNVPRVVGLYSGGNLAACGIFHPTGWCMMRNSGDWPRGEQQFCPVCRYALVDFVDPTMHYWNDQDYAEIYPGD